MGDIDKEISTKKSLKGSTVFDRNIGMSMNSYDDNSEIFGVFPSTEEDVSDDPTYKMKGKNIADFIEKSKKVMSNVMKEMVVTNVISLDHLLHEAVLKMTESTIDNGNKNVFQGDPPFSIYTNLNDENTRSENKKFVFIPMKLKNGMYVETLFEYMTNQKSNPSLGSYYFVTDNPKRSVDDVLETGKYYDTKANRLRLFQTEWMKKFKESYVYSKLIPVAEDSDLAEDTSKQTYGSAFRQKQALLRKNFSNMFMCKSALEKLQTDIYTFKRFMNETVEMQKLKNYHTVKKVKGIENQNNGAAGSRKVASDGYKIQYFTNILMFVGLSLLLFVLIYTFTPSDIQTEAVIQIENPLAE